jgi:hypothetical protein
MLLITNCYLYAIGAFGTDRQVIVLNSTLGNIHAQMDHLARSLN